MSISSIGNNLAAFQAQSVSATRPSNPQASGVDHDGDHDGSRVARGANRFASAISQALAQIGASNSNSNTTNTTNSTNTVTATASASDTDASKSSSDTAAQDPQQAVAAFAQNLFAALQAQAGGKPPPPPPPPPSGSNGSAAPEAINSNSGTQAARHGGHQHGDFASKIESGLQNLIQQIAASSNASANTSNSSSTNTSGNANSTTGNAALDALQESFNSLLSATGKSSSDTSLSSF